MITKITSENYGLYQALFEEASTKLNLPISNLDAYMANIDDLRAIEADPEHVYDHHFTILPLDEPPLAIDANSRQIEIPTSFKKNGLAVIGDHLAEMILFSIDRYYDTWDLLGEGMKAIVQWNTVQSGKDKKFGISTIDYVDATVLATERKLLLGWPIDNSMTEDFGSIKFSVRFYKIAEIKGEKHLVFSMNTIPTTLDIKNGLNFMDDKSFTQDSADISDIFEQRFNSGFGYVNGNGADTPWPIIPLSIYEDGVITPIFGENDDVNEPKKYDLIPQDNEETPYKLTIGLNSGGNGSISYEVVNSNSSATESTYKVYFETEDETVVGSKTYYTYDETTETYNPVILGEGTSLISEEDDTTYYECINCYDITNVGEYYIRTNNKVPPASNKYKDSGRIIIPGPATPTMEVNAHLFLEEKEVDGETKYSVTIPVIGHSEQEDDTLEYILSGFDWGSATPSAIRLSRQNLSNGEEYEFTIDNITSGEGDFSINKYNVYFYPTIISHRNGSEATSVDLPENHIRVTHRPELPIVTVTTTGDTPGSTLKVVITNEDDILSDQFIYKWCRVTRETDLDDESINPNTNEDWGTEDTFIAPIEGRYYCEITNKVNESYSEIVTTPLIVISQ